MIIIVIVMIMMMIIIIIVVVVIIIRIINWASEDSLVVLATHHHHFPTWIICQPDSISLKETQSKSQPSLTFILIELPPLQVPNDPGDLRVSQVGQLFSHFDFQLCSFINKDFQCASRPVHCVHPLWGGVRLPVCSWRTGRKRKGENQFDLKSIRHTGEALYVAMCATTAP